MAQSTSKAITAKLTNNRTLWYIFYFSILNIYLFSWHITLKKIIAQKSLLNWLKSPRYYKIQEKKSNNGFVMEHKQLKQNSTHSIVYFDLTKIKTIKTKCLIR